MKNIEQFNKCVGVIFAHLYGNFPRRTPIGLKRLPELEGTPHLVFNNTVQFLEEEGYVSFTGTLPRTPDGDVVGVRLTEKGLTILNAIPEAIDGGLSFGEQLSEHVKSGSWDALRDGVKSIISAGVKLAITAATT